RTEREHREAVEHDVHVAVLAKHTRALRKKLAVRLRVVGKFAEPPLVVRLAISADDASMSETHVLVHAGVRGVGDDDVDRRVRLVAEKRDAVLRANLEASR